MHNTRLDQLLEWLKEEPNDPFLMYAVATEYKKQDPGLALSYFETLLSNHENYTATYYHAAATYAQVGNHDKAKQIYEKGIEVCRRAGDRHALAELQRAYQDFQDQEEDS